jgi:glutathione S-transferase
MSRCVFVALSYSPWSEKARWVLDHHRIDYREVEHVPMLGAPLLRARLRRPFGRVTVPALIDGGRVLGDSLEIALHADRIGQGERLFPSGMGDAIATWNARSERILDAGRVLLLEKTLGSPEAMGEAMPSVFPRAFRTRMVWIGKFGVRFLERKYGAGGRVRAVEVERIARELEAFREVLSGPESYVLGRFTHADVVMAASLQVVWPVSNRWLPLGAATRVVWQEPGLAERFADLIGWRDWLYDRHR